MSCFEYAGYAGEHLSRRETWTGEPQLIGSYTHMGDKIVVKEYTVEKFVPVAKKQTTETVVEKTIVIPEVRLVEEFVDVPHMMREKIIEISKPVVQETLVEVPSPARTDFTHYAVPQFTAAPVGERVSLRYPQPSVSRGPAVVPRAGGFSEILRPCDPVLAKTVPPLGRTSSVLRVEPPAPQPRGEWISRTIGPEASPAQGVAVPRQEFVVPRQEFVVPRQEFVVPRHEFIPPHDFAPRQELTLHQELQPPQEFVTPQRKLLREPPVAKARQIVLSPELQGSIPPAQEGPNRNFKKTEERMEIVVPKIKTVYVEQRVPICVPRFLETAIAAEKCDGAVLNAAANCDQGLLDTLASLSTTDSSSPNTPAPPTLSELDQCWQRIEELRFSDLLMEQVAARNIINWWNQNQLLIDSGSVASVCSGMDSTGKPFVETVALVKKKLSEPKPADQDVCARTCLEECGTQDEEEEEEEDTAPSVEQPTFSEEHLTGAPSSTEPFAARRVATAYAAAACERREPVDWDQQETPRRAMPFQRQLSQQRTESSRDEDRLSTGGCIEPEEYDDSQTSD